MNIAHIWDKNKRVKNTWGEQRIIKKKTYKRKTLRDDFNSIGGGGGVKENEEKIGWRWFNKWGIKEK